MFRVLGNMNCVLYSSLGVVASLFEQQRHTETRPGPRQKHPLGLSSIWTEYDQSFVSRYLFWMTVLEIACVVAITVNSITVNTVNSLMFVGINVCVFEAKPCLRGLIFAVSSRLVSYLGTWIVCIVFIWHLRFKDAHELHLRYSPNKSLANINEFTVIRFI